MNIIGFLDDLKRRFFDSDSAAKDAVKEEHISINQESKNIESVQNTIDSEARGIYIFIPKSFDNYFRVISDDEGNQTVVFYGPYKNTDKNFDKIDPHNDDKKSFHLRPRQRIFNKINSSLVEIASIETYCNGLSHSLHNENGTFLQFDSSATSHTVIKYIETNLDNTPINNLDIKLNSELYVHDYSFDSDLQKFITQWKRDHQSVDELKSERDFILILRDTVKHVNYKLTDGVAEEADNKTNICAEPVEMPVEVLLPDVKHNKNLKYDLN